MIPRYIKQTNRFMLTNQFNLVAGVENSSKPETLQMPRKRHLTRNQSDLCPDMVRGEILARIRRNGVGIIGEV